MRRLYPATSAARIAVSLRSTRSAAVDKAARRWQAEPSYHDRLRWPRQATDGSSGSTAALSGMAQAYRLCSPYKLPLEALATLVGASVVGFVRTGVTIADD